MLLPTRIAMLVGGDFGWPTKAWRRSHAFLPPQRMLEGVVVVLLSKFTVTTDHTRPEQYLHRGEVEEGIRLPYRTMAYLIVITVARATTQRRKSNK